MNNQDETDCYWNAIVGNGGRESNLALVPGSLGLSWQITPRVLTDALAAGGDQAKRAFDAMMAMTKRSRPLRPHAISITPIATSASGG